MTNTSLDQHSTKRSLAAIMFTDIVGFTALMGESEEKALRNRRINREIHQQRIEAAGGTWLKEMGDGTMASFASITDALRAAIEIRKICKQEMGVELKVGIHFGEVTNEDNDVFGDGVNIASRIEALAVGGGILISESVYKDIKNKTDFKTAFLGETTLKNVEGRHKIYQVLDGDLVKPSVRIKSRISTLLAGMAALLLVLAAASYFLLWPGLFTEKNAYASIAVLPFSNASEDESQQHYGVGLATEIRSKLAQSKQFEFISSMQATMAYGNTDSPSKIGDELEVNYILSGIYQVSGERIKIDVELVETESGGVVWNLSFNELFTDIFELQSKIAARVFTEFSITDNQSVDAPTQNMEAYSYYLKGLASANNLRPTVSSSGRKLEAEELLSLAIQKDSSFADPYISLVKIKAYWMFSHPGSKGGEEYGRVLKEIMDLRDHAEVHFSSSPKYTLILGLIAYLVDHNFDEGQRIFEKVLNHDPENADAHAWIGAIYKRKLMHKEAIFHMSKARKLNPSDAVNWLEMLIVFANMGDYSSAEKAYQNAVFLGVSHDSNYAFIYTEQGKSNPKLKEVDPTKYYLQRKWYERDLVGYIYILDTLKSYDSITIARLKAGVYSVLGIQDSAKHYGQYVLDHTNGSALTMHAILGNKKEAIGPIHEAIGRLTPTDKMQYCHSRVDEIVVLSILGEYEEATDLLTKLNREYPSYGRYGPLFNNPFMDKIKREYPPFVEALNNLKLPPKLDLEGMIKF